MEGDGGAAVMLGALGDANLGKERGNGQEIGKGETVTRTALHH